MVITKDVNLPKEQELEVDEVNLSSATLMAAAPYIGKLCESVNNEFMLCRLELKDPRQCLLTGKLVTACTLEAFKRIKRNCLEEFKQYANCVDKSSGDFSFRYCRNTQAVLDECMKKNLCVERPHFGYFCRGRVHETARTKLPDPPCPCHSPVEDPSQRLPDCEPRPRARFNGRLYWSSE